MRINDLMNKSVDEIINIADQRITKSGFTFIVMKLDDGEFKMTIKPKKYDHIPKDINQRRIMISELRELGLSQVQIASVMELSQSSVSKLMKN